MSEFKFIKVSDIEPSVELAIEVESAYRRGYTQGFSSAINAPKRDQSDMLDTLMMWRNTLMIWRNRRLDGDPYIPPSKPIKNKNIEELEDE